MNCSPASRASIVPADASTSRAEKSAARNSKRAMHWAMRRAKARADAYDMERERMRNWKRRQAIAEAERVVAAAS